MAPAIEATTASPVAVWTRASLEAGHRRALPRAAALGALVLLGGASALALGNESPVAGYAGLSAVVVGAALLTPAVTVGLLRAAAPAARGLGGALGALAVRGVAASLSRTGVAVAALMVAVAATIGVSVMVASFRATVVRWLTSTLVEDVYVSPPAFVGSRDDASRPGVIARLRTAPEDRRDDHVPRGPSGASGAPTTSWPSSSTARASAGSGSSGRGRAIRRRSGRPSRKAAPRLSRRPLLVGAGRGRWTLRLLTDRGPRDLPVAGVFLDYRSDQGLVALSRRTYDALWDDRVDPRVPRRTGDGARRAHEGSPGAGGAAAGADRPGQPQPPRHRRSSSSTARSW